MVNCAVIGIGAMGKKYAAMLNSNKIEGLKLAAVCCRSDGNAAWARENLGGDVRIFKSEDELYKNEELFDAVIIVTPHKLHPAMAIRALKAGKHVMCDKPAGVTASGAGEINAVAEQSRGVYAMMCHQRTYEKYIKLKELLNAGAIGKLRRILMVNGKFFRTEFYHASASWRSSWQGEGGGALINQGYHLLDMWQYLFGMPESVYADIPFGKYNNFAVDDEATVIMNYPDKATGTFIISTGEGYPEERLEIAGTRGQIILDGQTLTLTRFGADLREYAKNAAVTSTQELESSAEVFRFGEPSDAYGKMLNNFAGAVLKGEKLIAPGQDGEKTLQIINAAYLSAWTGKKTDLPVDPSEYTKLLNGKRDI